MESPVVLEMRGKSTLVRKVNVLDSVHQCIYLVNAELCVCIYACTIGN